MARTSPVSINTLAAKEYAEWAGGNEAEASTALGSGLFSNTLTAARATPWSASFRSAFVTAERARWPRIDPSAVTAFSRIRVINLPPGAAPTSTIDLYVEGWAETVDAATYRVVFDTSPADNPPKMILDDTSYGRLQCDGQTLNAALTTAGATTVVVATAASKPTFTTVSARYPLKIKVGEEVIKLNTAPGGSTSPQTFTAVSRGQDGTTAAPQASGATVNLWPAAALAL